MNDARRRFTLEQLNIVDDNSSASSADSGIQDSSAKSIESASQRFGLEDDDKSDDENFVEGLVEMGIEPEIVVGADYDDDEHSELTLGEKSYVLDLGRQKVCRAEAIRSEALEEAHGWYMKA